MKELKDSKTWHSVKKNLEDVACPLFTDTELPDVLNARWWSDVGFTANKIFDKLSDEANSPPSKGVLADITPSTLLEVAEGVLSFDTFRWYKSKETACTFIVSLY